MNLEKYKEAFMAAFELDSEEGIDNLEYMGVETWDSVGHMTLISLLEDAFDIMMETDDIIDLSSFKKGMEILSNNYAVEF